MIQDPNASKRCYGGQTASARQQEQLFLDQDCQQKVALLLTELEIRVLSPQEVQGLRTTGRVLQTLTISPQTKEVSEAQLAERPLLVLFKSEMNVREAYKLLYSLLGLSKPVPKPRIKSSQQPSQQNYLTDALRRGMETGDGMLMVQHTAEIQMQPIASEPCGSSAHSPRGKSRDVRLSTYKRLDSLEETIRELENTLIEISGYPEPNLLYVESTNDRVSSQTPDHPTADTKKPPVPPKPSSIQVYRLLRVQIPALRHLTTIFPLHLFSIAWNFTSKPLVSAPWWNQCLIVFEIEKIERTDNRLLAYMSARCLV